MNRDDLRAKQQRDLAASFNAVLSAENLAGWLDKAAQAPVALTLVATCKIYIDGITQAVRVELLGLEEEAQQSKPELLE
jgi:hypothetical protein